MHNNETLNKNGVQKEESEVMRIVRAMRKKRLIENKKKPTDRNDNYFDWSWFNDMVPAIEQKLNLEF